MGKVDPLGIVSKDCCVLHPLPRFVVLHLNSIFANYLIQTPTNATLRGITNDDTDASVDTLRTSVLSVLTRFGVSVEEGLSI